MKLSFVASLALSAAVLAAAPANAAMVCTGSGAKRVCFNQPTTRLVAPPASAINRNLVNPSAGMVAAGAGNFRGNGMVAAGAGNFRR